jgi:uncharacterized protein (DUF1800 family)
MSSITPQVDPDWAWRPFVPSNDSPWSLALVGHLYRRAAFGAIYGELTSALEIGPQATIDRLINPEGDLNAFTQEYDRYEEAASGKLQNMRAWWLRRMFNTPDPLREKLTLFWHEHFATGPHRNESSKPMHDNVALLRRHALGSLDAMLPELLRDPAFLLSRDADQNRKAAPNDRYSTEILHRVLGEEADYTESDVHEAARALTGTFVYSEQTRFIPREFDEGEKTLLGTTGELGTDELINVLLQRPESSLNIVRGLYRLFISECDAPANELIQPLADQFAIDYDIRALVERMLRSNLFFSPVAYRRRVKSPVDYIVGFIRSMEQSVSTLDLSDELRRLGQELYNPPTLEGWPRGEQWLNAATLIGRANLVHDLLNGTKQISTNIDPHALADEHGKTGFDATSSFFSKLFLQSDVDEETISMLKANVFSSREAPNPEQIVAFVQGVVSLPEYQLS